MIRTLVLHAAQSYRNASAVEPNEPEPYYRLGRLIYSFYFECSANATLNPSPLCIADPSYFDAAHAREVIDAWDMFEKLAPLDPRLGVMREDTNALATDFDLLFRRAILHTRLADRPNLQAATRDYEAIVARADVIDENVLGNLAETYMMLDRLDDAIETYRRALRSSLRSETVYGLAVALDRDERGDQARELILSQGEQSVRDFEARVQKGETFFVPAGEEVLLLRAHLRGVRDERGRDRVLAEVHPVRRASRVPAPREGAPRPVARRQATQDPQARADRGTKSSRERVRRRRARRARAGRRRARNRCAIRPTPAIPTVRPSLARRCGSRRSIHERAPYEDLVREARHGLEEQSEHGALIAVDKLTDAIHRLPPIPAPMLGAARPI